jgi:hypothetical protein
MGAQIPVGDTAVAKRPQRERRDGAGLAFCSFLTTTVRLGGNPPEHRLQGASDMRRFLYILGAFAVAVIVICGVGIGVLVVKGNALDAESKAFVDRAVPAIAASWQKDQLLQRATMELRKNVTSDQLTALFETLSRLGPLVTYEGAKGEATISYFSGSGGVVFARYVANARFQNGRIVLLRRDGQWLIQNFRVDPVIGTNPRHDT